MSLSENEKIGKVNNNSNRILFLFLNLIGQVVSVTLIDGSCIEGLFFSSTSSEPLEFKLKQVRIVEKNKRSKKVIKIIPELIVKLSEVLMIDCKNIFFANEKTEYRSREFLTDSEISNQKSKVKKEKKLIKWEPENPDDENLSSYDLDHLDNGVDESDSPNAWDMYDEANVKSTYKETDYTTEIEWEKFSSEEIENAGKMAKEIVNSTDNVDNVHVRMERNEILNEEEIDSETLHSSVVREDTKVNVKRRLSKKVKDIKVFQQPRKLSKILLKRITKETLKAGRSRALSTPVISGKTQSLMRAPSYLKVRKSLLNPKNRTRLQKSYSYRIIGYSLDPGTPKVSAEIKKQFAKYVIEKGKTSIKDKKRQINELKSFLDDYNNNKIGKRKKERKQSLKKIIARNPKNIKNGKKKPKRKDSKKNKKDFKFNVSAKPFTPTQFQQRRPPFPKIPQQMILPQMQQIVNYQFSPPTYTHYQPGINQEPYVHQNHRPKFILENRIEKRRIKDIYTDQMARRLKKKKRDEKTKKNWGSKQQTYSYIPKNASKPKMVNRSSPPTMKKVVVNRYNPNYIPQQQNYQNIPQQPQFVQPVYPPLQPQYPPPQPYYSNIPPQPYYSQNVPPPQQYFQPPPQQNFQPQYNGRNLNYMNQNY